MIAYLRMTLFLFALTLLTGVVYPLTVTTVARLVVPNEARGSLITDTAGRILGSQLIAQRFDRPGYFHPRPSATDYAADAAGASNLGPTARDLRDAFSKRISSLQQENGHGPIPDDLVTASGSGLDPHISPAAALYQAERIARARGIPLGQVLALINRMTEGRTLGVLGGPRLNVLLINRELDKIPRQ
jgi:K+-transporting ATPase ATPase C chain